MDDVIFKKPLFHVGEKAQWEKEPMPVRQMIGHIPVVANLNPIQTVFLNMGYDIGRYWVEAPGIRRQDLHLMATPHKRSRHFVS